MLGKSFRKPNKIWEGKESKFYNRLIILWLRGNDIERHKEGKSFVAERFIRSLKNRIYNYTTAILKHVCIDKLDNIVQRKFK